MFVSLCVTWVFVAAVLVSVCVCLLPVTLYWNRIVTWWDAVLLLVMEPRGPQVNLESLYDLMPRNPAPTQWRREGDQMVMPALQSEFLDWILTPEVEREYKTIKAWCAAHKVTPPTTQAWRRDRRFRSEWERRADAKNLSVDRIQNVIDTLYEAACNGDVQAAKMYLQHIEKMRPVRQVDSDTDAEKLSDDELRAEIAMLLGDLRE